MLVILIGWLSSLQFRLIEARAAELTGQAIPLLSASQDLVNLLSIESAQINTLRDLGPTADLEAIRHTARNRQDRFAADLERFNLHSDDARIETDAAVLFETSARLLQLQVQRQEILASRARKIDELLRTIARMGVEIESLRLDVLTELQLHHQSPAGGTDQFAKTAELATTLSVLTGLSPRLEALARIIASKSGSAIEDRSKLEKDFLFSFREILGQTQKVRGLSQNGVFTTDLAQLRDLVSGAEGIFADGEALAAVLMQIDQSAVDSQEIIDNIRATITRTTETGQARAQTASGQLEQSVGVVATFNLVTILIFGLGFLGIVMIIVEFRLNKRIKALMQAVRALAQGDYTYQIDVRGEDELGKIAQSLRSSMLMAHDLERSNHDLQSFAYAASHDLKAPMLAIMDLADWTLEDFRDDLPADAVENLQLLKLRSERLARLLEDLLFYARVEGTKSEFFAVDLEEECANIADSLDPDGRFDLRVLPPVPVFAAAVVPLRQILGNLLSNAMKHNDRNDGRIEVSARIVGQNIEISVVDDGPGIAPEYHAKIFELFQKLESQDDVEGSGIGLALVKKLAQRHGDGVKVARRAPPNRGTQFTFTLRALALSPDQSVDQAA